MGASATATSYGGVVIRVNGGIFGAPIGQVAQSVARAANVLTVTGSAAWSGLQVGQYINLHGVRRRRVRRRRSGLDGSYRVRDVATTALVLEPIGAAPTGADIGTTNCGGAVLPRTDFRFRVMEFTRLITNTIGGFGRVDQIDPVLVTNAVSAVTVTGGVAQDAAAGNPVGIGARAANANQAAMSATGDLVHLMATMIGALVNKPFSIPEADWSYAPAGTIANTADVVIAAAAGAGIRRYVTSIQLINTNAVATEFVVKDGSTVIWRIWLPANMTTPWDIDFPAASLTANAALNAAAITSGASIYLDAQGYTAP